MATKEPGHFEVRTSSGQVARMHFFPKKLTFFSRRPQDKGRLRHWDCFNVKIKQSSQRQMW